jgi:hypothetical protein
MISPAKKQIGKNKRKKANLDLSRMMLRTLSVKNI